MNDKSKTNNQIKSQVLDGKVCPEPPSGVDFAFVSSPVFALYKMKIVTESTI